jgi:hypothetical protein
MTDLLNRAFAAGMCFGCGTMLLLLHIAAWAGTAVVLAEWLRVGLGVVGLALIAAAHFLRVGLLSDPHQGAGPRTLGEPN